MGRQHASSDPRDRSVLGMKALMLCGLALLLLILLLLMVVAPESAGAATHWLTVQLTDNDTLDRNVSIDGQFVAWTGIDAEGGGDADVFLRNLSSALTSNLSNNDVSADENVIVDGALAAWCMNETPGSSDPAIPHIQIMVHDLGLGTTEQLTTGDNWMHLAENRAGHVCFYGGVGFATMEVFYYDHASHVTTQITDNDDRDMDGSANGSRIAWNTTTDLFPYIMVRNMATHVTMPLSIKGSHVQGHPIVRGNKIAFLEKVGTDWEVFVKDLVSGTEARVSDDDVDSQVYGFDGEKLLWGDIEAPFEGEPSVGRLYIYDLAAHTSHAITDDDICNPAAVVWTGDMVAWISQTIPGDDNSGEVFVYDRSTGDTQQLTHNRVTERSLDTDGLRVAWTGETGAGGLDSVEVFVATPLARLFPFFRDVRITHPYYAAIQALRARDLFGGYTVGWNTDFRPDDPLFRAQFAKMLCNAFQINVSEGMSSPFTDLGPDDLDSLYPHEFVAAALTAGITNGISLTTFSPFANVSRAQVVTMMVRAAQQLKPGLLATPQTGYTSSLPSFSAIHGPNMQIAEFNGLLEGLQGFGATWDPWAPATRGETAQLLWNLLSIPR
jgi:hypothetical protein